MTPEDRIRREYRAHLRHRHGAEAKAGLVMSAEAQEWIRAGEAERLRRALAAAGARDWGRVLAWFDRTMSMALVRGLWRDGSLSGAELREALAEAWGMDEADTTRPDHLRLWEAAYGHGGRIEDAGDPLPEGDPVMIHRGQHIQAERTGISWTLDRRIAAWFAVRGADHDPPSGWILSGIVARGAILAYLNGRPEREVIVHPRNVRNVRWAMVEGRQERP